MATESGMSLNEVQEISFDRKVAAFQWLSVDDKLTMIYQEILELRAYVADLEKKASVMASPEGMQQVIQGMMGSMF